MALKIAGDTIISDSGKTLAQLVAEVEASTAGKLPIGFVFLSVDDTNPKDLLGYGTWDRIAKGQYLIGVDESNTNFATSMKTGGSWTHSHTYSHTHTMPHTHTITSHTHALNSSGYAKIFFGSSSFQAYDFTTSSWSGNAKKTVSGSTSSSTFSATYGVGLGGKTGDSSSTPASGAASSSTTATQSATTTSTTTSISPYYTVYAWRRTA